MCFTMISHLTDEVTEARKFKLPKGHTVVNGPTWDLPSNSVSFFSYECARAPHVVGLSHLTSYLFVCFLILFKYG